MVNNKRELFIAIISTVISLVISAYVRWFANPDNSEALGYFIIWFPYLILFIVLFSFFKYNLLQFRIETSTKKSDGIQIEIQDQSIPLHNELAQIAEDQMRIDNLKKQKFINGLYSCIAAFLIAVIGLIYTVYSDVINEQGDPVSPVIHGIRENELCINLESDLKLLDSSSHLIFVIDLSGSINKNKQNDKVKIGELKNFLIENSLDSEHTSQRLEHISVKNCSGLEFLQMNAIKALYEMIKKLTSNNGTCIVTIMSFNTLANIKLFRYPILDNNFIDSTYFNVIMNLRMNKLFKNQTDMVKVIDKVDRFVKVKDKTNNHKDNFLPQRNVVNIFSDLIHDVYYDPDSKMLEEVISNLGNIPIYINLCQPTQDLSCNMVPIFKNNFNNNSVNMVNLSDKINVLKRSNFNSEHQFKIILSNPFYVDSCNVKLFVPNGYENLTMQIRGNIDELQQFSLNTKSLPNNSVIKLNEGINVVNFKGHAPDRFPKIIADINVLENLSTISYEVVFIKGMPANVANMIYIIFVLLLDLTIFYAFYVTGFLKHLERSNLNDGFFQIVRTN